MKTVTTSSVLLLFTALLAGCVRDDMTPQTGGAGRVFTVSYSFDTPQTRAAATGAECEVKDVAIFFYNADDTNPANETYVDCQSTNIPGGSGSSGSFPLPLPTTIVQGNKYKLIIIGNYNRYLPEGRSLADYADLYKTRTCSKMKDEIQGQLISDAARVTNPLPFCGRLLGKDGNETTLTGPSPTDINLGVSVKFSRAVSRFDVVNLAAGSLKIAWVKVCNYRNRGCFFHESVSAGEIVRGTSAQAPGLPLPSGYVAAPEPSGTPGALRQNLNEGGLYAFANAVSYTSQDDKLTTCLMIAGYFKKAGDAGYSPRLTYYRANISENGNSQMLRRNYIYTVAINNVKKEGADTEEGAINEKEKLLDYVVGDDWHSDSGGTVTDKLGNFLTLSRTSIVLGSGKDESALIKVAVKKGTGWNLDWKSNPEGAFRFEKVDDNSFNIITTGKNETVFTRNAALTVSVTGIAATVSLTVNVIQLSAGGDPQMLTVEGQSSDFEYVVPGQGGVMSLQVITGGSSSQWRAEADNDLAHCVNSCTPEGANTGFVDLTFMPNPGEERRGMLTVTRLLPNGNADPDVAPVHVTFVQGKSPYMVTLLPNYPGGLEIDGFSARKGNPNGIGNTFLFNVLLADPEHYTFSATCTFNKNSDAFLSLEEDHTALAGPLHSAHDAPSTVTGKNGQSVWLNVFRTGPGDASIKGKIDVTAVANAGTGLENYTIAISVRIVSGCRISDTRVGNVLWPDRNTGTMRRTEGSGSVGLNYSVDPKNDDNNNLSFKGGYSNFKDASTACSEFGKRIGYEGELATGWRLPSSAEQKTVAGRMYFSKQRAFILSDDGASGCWFPLSGFANEPSDLNGNYWSADIFTGYASYYMKIIPTGSADASVSTAPYYMHSVRCVRDMK